MNTTELARAAGVHPLAMSEEYISGLERLVAAAVAAEREACAKVCDAAHARHIAEYGDYLGETYASECADAIRARGQA